MKTKLKIRSSEIKGNKINEIIEELYTNAEVMDIIKAHSLIGGDAIEAMASDLEAGYDIDTDDYLHIC